MFRKNKIKIIITGIASLFLILIAVIYLNFFSGDNSSNPPGTNENKTGIIKEKFAEDIDSIIYTFGIKKEWIRNISLKEKQTKNNSLTLWISKEVIIPADLPVIELNHEITNYLRINNFEDKVTEDPKTKAVRMNVFDTKDTAHRQIGNINFIYSDTVKRDAASICIVLDSLESYNLTDVEKILSSAQEYSVILPLRNDKAEYQSKIIEAKKDFLLNFTLGGEKDIAADFRSDMKENLWKSKIRAAGINFPNVSGIILTGNGSSEEFENEVTNEFIKNNLVVYKDTIFAHPERREDIVGALLKDLILKTGHGKNELYYKINLNASEFSEFESKVYTLKKAGYKFFTFKDLLKKTHTANMK